MRALLRPQVHHGLGFTAACRWCMIVRNGEVGDLRRANATSECATMGKRQRVHKSAVRPRPARDVAAISFAMRTMAVVCIAIGLALSSFLVGRSFQLLDGHSADVIDVCRRVLGGSCAAALDSREWWFLGISPAGWGLVYYFAFGVLFVLVGILREQFAPQAYAAAVILSVAGTLLSLYLGSMMALGIAPFCPLCLLLQSIPLLLVPITLRLSLRSSVPFPAAMHGVVNFVRGAIVGESRSTWWNVIAFTLCAAVALVVYQWVLLQTERRLAAVVDPFDLETAWTELNTSPRREIPIDESDPRLGPVDAPIQLVVFSDFGCSGCREFAAIPQGLADRFPEDLKIVFKHLPTVETKAASIAAQAAHRQGKFWEYHDALFSDAGTDLEVDLRRTASQVRLSLDRFTADLHDPSTRRKVELDMALANDLGVDATPAVFLNGHRIRQVSLPLLSGLMDRLRKGDAPE